MQWLHVNDQKPILNEMLVVCKDCGHVHAVVFDYDEYNLPEWCDSGRGPHSPGKSIDFDWYMPLPKPPNIDK